MEVEQKKEEEIEEKADKNEAEIKEEKDGEKDGENKEGDEKKEEEKGPAPFGNGGTTDKYIWTQTLDELHVYIPCPDETKAKDLIVNIESKNLLVAWKKD